MRSSELFSFLILYLVIIFFLNSIWLTFILESTEEQDDGNARTDPMGE